VIRMQRDQGIGKKMLVQRHRVKPTSSLEERLAAFAKEKFDKAARLPPGANAGIWRGRMERFDRWMLLFALVALVGLVATLAWILTSR
jgi:hypothetical protein